MPDASMSDDSALILDAVDKFLEKDVAPYVRNLEAADEYPTAGRRQVGRVGHVRRDDLAGIRSAWGWRSKPIRKLSSGWQLYGCRFPVFSIRT